MTNTAEILKIVREISRGQDFILVVLGAMFALLIVFYVISEIGRGK